MTRKKIEMLVILLGDEERMRKKIETLVVPSGVGFANHHPESDTEPRPFVLPVLATAASIIVPPRPLLETTLEWIGLEDHGSCQAGPRILHFRFTKKKDEALFHVQRKPVFF